MSIMSNKNPFDGIDSNALAAVASLMEGWSVFYNVPSDMFTDECNEENLFSARRTVAPFCGKDRYTQWNGSTPWEAIQKGMESINEQ